MDDLVNRLARELPGTDTSRYDIAYRRGRAQARSSLLFGGLAFGSVAGALTMLLFDPIEGRSRRAGLGRRLEALGNDLRRTAKDRGADLRIRAMGAATELGLPGTPPSNEELRAERAQEATHARLAFADRDEDRTPVAATTADLER